MKKSGRGGTVNVLLSMMEKQMRTHLQLTWSLPPPNSPFWPLSRYSAMATRD